MQSTDKILGFNPMVYSSGQVYYNKKFRRNAEIVNKIVQKAFPVATRLLDIPNDISFRVCNFKRGTTRARYRVTDRLVEISSQLDRYEMLTALAHELVHAEQYHQKRFETKWLNRRGWVNLWNGQICNNRGSTYQSYLKQPWEKEAFERQEIIAKQIVEEVGRQYDELQK